MTFMFLVIIKKGPEGSEQSTPSFINPATGDQLFCMVLTVPYPKPT